MISTSPQESLRSYAPVGDALDEALTSDGQLRPHWEDIAQQLDDLGSYELLNRQRATVTALDNDGVTYHSQQDESQTRRRWQLDALPMVIPHDEWTTLADGFAQRCEVLNAVLTDLYGARTLFDHGVVPVAMILSDPMFLRSCDGIHLPTEKQLFLASSDLARGSNGQWTVLADRTQVPSGAGYALENRSVISQLFPRLYRSNDVRQLSPFFEKLRAELFRSAPAGVEHPRAVVLSPGVLSETAFEHAFLAAELGIPLVEGSDLTMRDGAVFMRSVSGDKPVHVILRRVDGWYCDPLELQEDSQLGVAGLTTASRLQSVSVVNPVGSGVCENNGLNAFLNAACQHFFGEDLRLHTAQSWWCGDQTSLSHVMANLSELVIRPTSRRFDAQAAFGSELSAAETENLRRKIQANPHLWVGQERIEPATSPTICNRELVRRRTVLRTFAVADEDSYFVMSGGLTRVAQEGESLHVTNRSGAASKDTWILRGTADTSDLVEIDLGADLRQRGTADPAALASRSAENLFWLGRYAERAEAAARLIRAVNRRRLDFQDSRPGPGLDSLNVMLDAITQVTATYPGFAETAAERSKKPFDELFALIVNPDREGTIRQSIDRLISNAEGLRDQLSTDNWLVAGSLQQHLIDFGTTEPQEQEEAMQRSLGRILTELLALSGIGSESLVRDPAWCYLDIGRRIERGIQVLRLLQACLTTTHPHQTEKLVVLTFLAASESSITYRRRYQSRPRTSAAVELLLTADDNPRSIRFQVNRLTEDLSLLAKLMPSETTRPTVEAARHRVAELMESATVTDLIKPDEQSLRRSALANFTSSMIVALEDLSMALTHEDFPKAAPQHQIALTESP